MKAMYRKRSNSWLKHIDFLFFDLLCLQLSFVAGYVIRHGFSSLYLIAVYRNMAVVLAFIEVFVVFFNESFKSVLKRGYYIEFIETVKHVFLVLMLGMGYLVFTQDANAISRIVLALTGVFYFVSTYLVRVLWKKHLNVRRKSGRKKRSLLIITSRDMIDLVINNIKDNNYEGFIIAGLVIIDADMEGETTDAGIKVVANTDTAVEFICREWVDEVFINLQEQAPLSEQLINDIVEMGVTVHLMLAKVQNLKGKKQHIEKLGTYTVLTTSINMATPNQAFFKRLMDILGSLAGCAVAGILFLFVAPFIYIKSPGPVLFSQIRVGKNGKRFKMYKFRSMYMDAEERKKELMEKNKIQNGMMFKMDDDPRIIGGSHGIGAFIRKTSIDEWPQMWNVLKGDMSLVGTRPPTEDEWNKYKLHHRARLAIKPGVTGMWQISGRSKITDFEQVVELDTSYITDWSFSMDLKILLKTIQVVFQGKGSM